jgi:hypothetical protein
MTSALKVIMHPGTLKARLWTKGLSVARRPRRSRRRSRCGWAACGPAGCSRAAFTKQLTCSRCGSKAVSAVRLVDDEMQALQQKSRNRAKGLAGPIAVGTA